MEKEVAKVFKNFAPKKKLKVMKNYKAKAFSKDEERTCGIKTSRLHLRITIASILAKGSKEQRVMVANALNSPMREDSTDTSGQYVFY